MSQPPVEDFLLTVILDEEVHDAQSWIRLHQCLLMLFDSPLNHSKHLEVYIRLLDKRLIKLHRELRLPRTFKRFEQLFSNFLQGNDMPTVQTSDGGVKLLRFVAKSLDMILPSKCLKFRISNLAPRLKHADYFVQLLNESNLNKVVIFIDFDPVNFNILGDGIETEYEVKTLIKQSDEDVYSISRYPLASSLTCVKITSAFENKLSVF